VWDAVILLALLEYYADKNSELQVSHTTRQKEHFRNAMKARNTYFQTYGIGQTLHRCNKCVRFLKNDGLVCMLHIYYVQIKFHLNTNHAEVICAVVIDGITIGHPCCTVHNCQLPLQKQRDRFCIEHTHFHTVCSIWNCEAPVVEGYLVCSDEAHLAIEQRH
jgi:hypothetical protein